MREFVEKCGYYPRVGVWELTLRCNLSCLHCGSKAGKARDDEMSIEEMVALVPQLAALGTQQITLSGGDPLVFEEWPILAKALVAHGINVNMITNGLAFEREAAKMVKEAGLSNICFSLDGLEANHDLVRNKKGMFEKVMACFEICREEDISSASIMTINKRNMHEMDQIFDLLVENKVDVWQVQITDPMGNVRDNEGLAVDPADLLEIIPKLVALKKRSEGKLKMAMGDNIGFFGDYEEGLRHDIKPFGFWFGCLAGCQVIGIEANGNIKGCLSQQAEEFVEGNVRHQTLAEIWNRDGGFAYNRQFEIEQLEGFCRECQYAKYCRGGCTCAAHFNSGSRFDNPMCIYRMMELAKRVKEEAMEARP